MSHQGTPHNQASMSFEEIGRELGITRSAACMIYMSAMRKLRRGYNARTVERIRELVALKNRDHDHSIEASVVLRKLQ